ncbi:siderophore-interacting protein [Alteromonas sp. D210916BOD_24]|uniref:siderophore-interacting protein n=1 Tax=Alteromonas sp. D210916BOD_24 TaxID=3157618 RepID=UPI00399CA0A9
MTMQSPRKAFVTHTARLTPHIQRIHLTGEDLLTIPNMSSGAYIKLMFDLDGHALQEEAEPSEIAMRTYTVSQFNPALPEMILDMVLQANEGITGPASAWAHNAQQGDSILFRGPGTSRGLCETYDWVLFAGDLTALPSIRSHLAQLPPDTTGYAVVHIEDQRDVIELDKPEGVKVIWNKTTSLSQRLRSLPWMAGMPGVWVACEFSSMREIRTWLTHEMQLAHQQIYISSYWKRGRSEDQHKIDKCQDNEAFLRQHSIHV